MNIRVKILQLLANHQEPLRKEQIVQELDSTINTVANGLASLTSKKLVKQSKGFYIITIIGREQLKRDPFLTDFTVQPARTDIVDWNIISKSGMCMEILKNRSMFENASPETSRIFLPFVIMYMLVMGHHVPHIEDHSESSDVDSKIKDAVNVYLDFFN